MKNYKNILRLIGVRFVIRFWKHMPFDWRQWALNTHADYNFKTGPFYEPYVFTDYETTLVTSQ